MDSKFSKRIKDILTYSREEAVRLGNDFISTEHFFLGMMREGGGLALDTLEVLGADLDYIRSKIELEMRKDDMLKNKDYDNIPLLKPAEDALKMIYLEAKDLQDSNIDSEHLLLAILKDKESIVTQILDVNNIDYELVKNRIYDNKPEARSSMHDDEDEDDAENFENRPNNPTGKSTSETPVLDNFGIDLTKAAEEDQLDPIIGRDVEIERLVQILSRRKKNNPVLIGEPGVGKSAIVEGLAMRIIKRKVSRVLFDKRIVTLDLASIVAGTKYRGQFEERMKSILNELARTTEIILFIDEIHTIVGAGGASGSLDAANMLKPALARGDIQCIGATTLDEYRQHIEKDGALERRFQKIMVDPTTAEETIEILKNIKERYEDHHNVYYTPEALEACVKLSLRYISDRHLPDKAIDALDEAGSRVHISKINVPKRIDELEREIEEIRKEKIQAVKSQQFELAASHRDKEQELLRMLDKEKLKWEKDMLKNRETVDETSVEQVIAMMTGIPVQRIAQAEGSRLLKMFDEIGNKVIGQSEAIKKIVKSIQRNRAGLKDPNKPIGSFIFLGPTGVGKTQLAKVLSQFLFDTNNALVRIDMSEYMEKFSVSRLVGAPPGYVGYEEGGQLTEKVRRKPYSVVLMDEIEKAHPDVFNILLQVLDEGQLTDSLGRKVDFKNTIIIMTSNIGTRQLQDFGRVGFGGKDNPEQHNKNIIQKALKKAFAPEFLNRVDDVVMFNSLKREDLHKIIDIELKGLYSRVEELGYTLEITKNAKDFLVDKGYDIKFGARPLKRAIQKYVEDEMAEVIIQATIQEGDAIIVDVIESDDSKLNISIIQDVKVETSDSKNEVENIDENNKNE